MDIVIHDLQKYEWDTISQYYADSRIISDNGTIKKCVGCFGCWIRTPGQCIIPDDYQRMGEWISKADKVTIISKCSFGSYSSFVKNVLDRSISYVLPYFEIRKGEMHHKVRYKKHIRMNVIFYGEDITENERRTARELVTANALNLNGIAEDVVFTAREELASIAAKAAGGI